MPLTEVMSGRANELLLTQLIREIIQISPEVDPLQLRIKISNILSLYEVKPIRLVMKTCSSLEEKISLFLASKQLEGLSKITLEGYKVELKLFAKYIKKSIEQITTTDIRAYLGQFQHLKISSLNRRLSVLKSFFGWLASEEIIQRDPTKKIKPPKTEKALPKSLTIEELEMLREACRTPRERALVEVFYATGCRLSEIWQLNRQDINWQTQSARVIGKGSKEREVFFSVKAIFYLRKYLMTRLDNELALFITERKPYRRLSKRAIQREIRLIARRANIDKNVHPHVLRHTFATLTLNNGADISTIQAILGHSSPATTQIYAEVTDERKKEQYRKHLVQ